MKMSCVQTGRYGEVSYPVSQLTGKQPTRCLGEEEGGERMIVAEYTETHQAHD